MQNTCSFCWVYKMPLNLLWNNCGHFSAVMVYTPQQTPPPFLLSPLFMQYMFLTKTHKLNYQKRKSKFIIDQFCDWFNLCFFAFSRWTTSWYRFCSSCALAADEEFATPPPALSRLRTPTSAPRPIFGALMSFRTWRMTENQYISKRWGRKRWIIWQTKEGITSLHHIQ